MAPPEPVHVPAPPGPAPSPTDDGGRSRVTAVVRLAAGTWLVWTSGSAIAEPARAAAARGTTVEVLLPLAGLSFAIGAFLLSGFMSRIGGVLLAGLAIWELVVVGWGVGPLLLAPIGVYLLLRGGGAWGMDVYVQQMQERIRRREQAQSASPDPRQN